MGTRNPLGLAPVCARCLKRDDTCKPALTRYRWIDLCTDCGKAPDCLAWIRRLDFNRAKLDARGFVSLDLAIERAHQKQREEAEAARARAEEIKRHGHPKARDILRAERESNETDD